MGAATAVKQTLKGEATRERIVEAAAQAASVRGLSAVSLQDIADLVGLSKSGLFKHFQAKEAMQMAVLEWATQRFLDRVWWPFRDGATARVRLVQVFDAWLDWVAGSDAPGGCLLQAAAIELDDQPGPLRDYLRVAKARWLGRLRDEFKGLAHPALDDEEADQASFEMKGFILSYIEQRRLLEDDRARGHAKIAFNRLLDRLEGGR